MDPRLLKYYNSELQHLREVGGEFARAYPKIAGRLALDQFECADPYVERLLEGFAFLTSRVQLKIDAEFPRFTQHLLETVYPDYLAPTPSLAVVQLQPDLGEGSLAQGFVVPRDSALRSILGKGDQTACEYRTAQDVTLWPLKLASARYLRDVGTLDLPQIPGVRAGIQLKLECTAGLTFDKLPLDRLSFYLHGKDELRMHIYEQLLGNSVGMVARPASRPVEWQEVIAKSGIRRMGFEDSQALLPYRNRSFHGYRLLHEYFALPDRFLFVELCGLAPAVRRCSGTELELILLLDRSDTLLENAVDASHFSLFCTPGVNLFPRRADRIHLSERQWEYHVVPDRTRPVDFEIYDLTEVVGFGRADQEQEFLPFYSSDDLTSHRESMAYYTVHRTPRLLSGKQRQYGTRSSYVGSEVFISLVDAREAPYPTDLRQLAIRTLCTNRDLPLHMSIGQGTTDFTMESGAPVEAVRCLAGPTKPMPSHAEGETAWRLISHLSLNYLSLVDNDARQGAAAMRDVLRLYGDSTEAYIRKQIDGLRSISCRPVTRRVTRDGPIAFARGLEVTVTFDETAFEGSGMFLLGAVLEEFFARYVSINSFTETVVRSLDRGEVMRWPNRTGGRHLL